MHWTCPQSWSFYASFIKGYKMRWQSIVTRFCENSPLRQKLGNILRYYLGFGNICNPLWQHLCYWAKFHVCKCPNWKQNLAIWLAHSVRWTVHVIELKSIFVFTDISEPFNVPCSSILQMLPFHVTKLYIKYSKAHYYSSVQCDQTRRNFATLAKFFKYLIVFRGFI